MPDDTLIKEIRKSVATICKRYGENYWRELDEVSGYPTKFVAEITQAGFLTALIPEEFGGMGLGLREACEILEEISLNGAHPGACHAQMYVMGSLLRHGSQVQKETYLPQIANGTLRLQSFAVTEPTTGSDTTQLKTTAILQDDQYLINGQKVWISRVEHSDLMVLLARTKPIEQCTKKSDGLSAFIVDLRDAIGSGLTIQPIPSMINHHSCELFFDNLKIPAKNLLGKLDHGFRVILDGMNAERILIAAECIGDANYFINKSVAYANEREVFGRPIGANQGIQFPLARAHAQTTAARLVVKDAAEKFDSSNPCGAEANMAKLLAADASWAAGDACMQTFGGYSFSKEYHIERKFRETRLYQIAPVSTNLILTYLAERELGLPRSY